MVEKYKNVTMINVNTNFNSTNYILNHIDDSDWQHLYLESKLIITDKYSQSFKEKETLMIIRFKVDYNIELCALKDMASRLLIFRIVSIIVDVVLFLINLYITARYGISIALSLEEPICNLTYLL